MASNRFIVFAIAAILLPSAAMAAEYVVGGDQGWNRTVNYTEWASDKMFYEGDVLVFKYEPTKHNVIKVDADGFKSCNTSGPAFTSGNDIFTLTPGKKWYICGIADHCSTYNQKVVVNVLSSAPAPAPNTGAPFGLASSWYHILAAVAAVVAPLIML